jgi:uncharacterized protein (DUF2062 family)
MISLKYRQPEAQCVIKKWIEQRLCDPNQLKNSSQNRFLNHAKHFPSIWKLNRTSVSLGVAIGLFVAMIPVLSFQTLLVILLSILFRANLPIAFMISWVSNPITILPLAYLAYCIGNWVLGIKSNIDIHNIHLTTTNFHDFWSTFSVWIAQFGKGFFVGLPILAFGVALAGYFIVSFCWYLSDFLNQKDLNQKKRKK